MGESGNVKVQVEDRVAVLTLDNPPLNTINGETYDALEAAVASQLLRKSDGIDRGAALREPSHRLEDDTVGLTVEVVGDEDLPGGVEGVVVEQYGAENGALGVQVVWQRACLGQLVRHSSKKPQGAVRGKRLVAAAERGND